MKIEISNTTFGFITDLLIEEMEGLIATQLHLEHQITTEPRFRISDSTTGELEINLDQVKSSLSKFKPALRELSIEAFNSITKPIQE